MNAEVAFIESRARGRESNRTIRTAPACLHPLQQPRTPPRGGAGPPGWARARPLTKKQLLDPDAG